MPPEWKSWIHGLVIPKRAFGSSREQRPALHIDGLETRVAISRSALKLAALTDDELKELLAKWPWQQLIMKLGVVEHLRYFLSQADWNVDGMLLRSFVESNLQGPADELLSSGGIIANQFAAAYLVQRALELGVENSDRGGDDHADFANVLFVANDELFPNTATTEESVAWVHEQFAVRLMLDHSIFDLNALKHSIPRHYHLLTNLAVAGQREPGAVEIEKSIIEATGANLRQLFAFCLASFGYFTSLSSKAKEAYAHGRNSPVKPEDYVLDRQIFLSNMDFEDGGSRLLEQLSTDPERRSAFGSKSAFDFEHLKRRPIVKLDDKRMLIPIPQFLLERVTVLLYWDVHSLVPHKDQNTFESWWGVLSEQYVHQLLERALGVPGGSGGRWFKPNQYGLKDGAPPSPDAIVVIHSSKGLALAFVEVKSSRPKYVDMVTGDTAALRIHWGDRLIGDAGNPKAVRQIDRAIDEFRKGNLELDGVSCTAVERIFPVVVTLDQWPLRATLYQRFADDVRSAGLLSQAGVVPIEVFSCEEVEMLVGAAENGSSLGELLDRRFETSAQSIPIRDWMKAAPLPSILHETWDRMLQDLAEVFPKADLPS